MAFNSNFGSAGVQGGAGSLDAGLRTHMCRVFNWMTLGLAITGLMAYAVAETSLRELFFSYNGYALRPTLLGIVTMFSPLAFILVLRFGIDRLSRQAVQGIFLLFSVAMGASLSTILMHYTGVSVVRTFFICAVMFGSMALWGYTTGTNLVRFGSFLCMGLIGIIIAMVVNFFLHSSALATLVSLIGVVLFTVFAAYDTQRIKISYQQSVSFVSQDDMARLSVYDALSMYLNFVNLFQFLIQFTGVRTNNNN